MVLVSKSQVYTFVDKLMIESYSVIEIVVVLRIFYKVYEKKKIIFRDDRIVVTNMSMCIVTKSVSTDLITCENSM